MEMLSKLEEQVLISILKLGEDAYGTSIYTHIIGLTGREVTVSSIYFLLERLMRRGFLLAALRENRALNLATWRGVANLIKRAEA